MRLHFTRKQCELILEGIKCMVAIGRGETGKNLTSENEDEIIDTIKAKIAKEMAPRTDK